jgi:hypothetical protein
LDLRVQRCGMQKSRDGIIIPASVPLERSADITPKWFGETQPRWDVGLTVMPGQTGGRRFSWFVTTIRREISMEIMGLSLLTNPIKAKWLSSTCGDNKILSMVGWVS